MFRFGFNTIKKAPGSIQQKNKYRIGNSAFHCSLSVSIHSLFIFLVPQFEELSICHSMYNVCNIVIITNGMPCRSFCKNSIDKCNSKQTEWGIGNLKAHFLYYTPLQFWQMWPLHLPLTWPLSTVPPVATTNFSGSAMLQCSTAMCESTALLSLRSHSLSLFQFPKDYQQQYITSTVGKVPPLPSCTSSSSSPLPLVAQT